MKKLKTKNKNIYLNDFKNVKYLLKYKPKISQQLIKEKNCISLSPYISVDEKAWAHDIGKKRLS